jgi:hypothetical protein
VLDASAPLPAVWTGAQLQAVGLAAWSLAAVAPGATMGARDLGVWPRIEGGELLLLA